MGYKYKSGWWERHTRRKTIYKALDPQFVVDHGTRTDRPHRLHQRYMLYISYRYDIRLHNDHEESSSRSWISWEWTGSAIWRRAWSRSSTKTHPMIEYYISLLLLGFLILSLFCFISFFSFSLCVIILLNWEIIVLLK